MQSIKKQENTKIYFFVIDRIPERVVLRRINKKIDLNFFSLVKLSNDETHERTRKTQTSPIRPHPKEQPAEVVGR